MTPHIKIHAPTATTPAVHYYGGKSNSDDDINPDAPMYSICEGQIVNSISHVYINQGIGEPAVYTALIHHLVSRSQGDIVYMHFNCYGGRLDAGIEILTAMSRCEGTIVGCLDGHAYSMAALMFLRCHEYMVSEFGTLMLHTYSGGGVGGKAPDQRTAQAAIDQAFLKLVNTICVPFLSNRETKEMLEHGRDLYFSADEIIDRLTKMAEPKAKRKRPTKKAQTTEPELESDVEESADELTLLLEVDDNSDIIIDSNNATLDVS